MIVIGVVLLIAGVGFGLDLWLENGYAVDSPVVFGQALSIHHVGGVFLLGVITGAAILLGVLLVLSGIGRRGRAAIHRRRERRVARSTAHDRDQLAADRDQLAADNAELHRKLDEPVNGDPETLRTGTGERPA